MKNEIKKRNNYRDISKARILENFTCQTHSPILLGWKKVVASSNEMKLISKIDRQEKILSVYNIVLSSIDYAIYDYATM